MILQWYKKSLYREMVIKLVVFLILPFLSMIGIFYGKLLQDGEQSYRNSTSLVMEQAESARSGYITDILKVADRISSNSALKGFLLTQYSYRNWNYYSDEITRMVSGGLSYENRIIPKIYFENSSIPRGYNMFYHLDDISSSAPIAEFMASSRTEQWVTPPMAAAYSVKAAFTPFSDHYTYMRKVYSDQRVLYLLTLSVERKEMDSFLYQDHDQEPAASPQIVAAPDQLLINYTGEQLDIDKMAVTGAYESEDISFEKMRFPQKITYVWGPSPQRQYYLFGFVPLLAFGFFSIFINIQFVRRIFSQIISCIDKFGNSVKNGCYEPLPVTGENEIAQITGTFNALIGKIQNLMELTAQQTALAKESQLKALRQQIGPHFLYNTLEVFSYRMELYGHTEESDAIASFSGLLRYSLAKEGNYATIQEELEQVNRYIHIQKLKYESVELEAAVPPELMKAKVIRFLLQPLVENSFSHGYCGKPMRIRLSCIDLKDSILFEICDNGKGIPADRLQEVRESLETGASGSEIGIGLENIDQRLKLFYSEGSALHVDSQEGAWTMVTFQIPR